MNILIIFYNLLLILLAPLLFILGILFSYKRGDLSGYLERFGAVRNLNKPPSNTQSILFHAASVGEVRSIKSLISKIRDTIPNINIVISTMTTTGRDIAKNEIVANNTFLLPIENSYSIKKIIRKLNIRTIVIVDTELWINFISSASKLAPVILINARLSENRFKLYKFFQSIFKYILNKIDTILTKSDEDFYRFNDLAPNHKKIKTIGNIKFNTATNIKNITQIKNLSTLKYIFIASTHNNEEEQFMNAFINNRNKFDKLIIAPRHIHRAIKINQLATSLGLTSSLYSESNFNTDLIIIDQLGLLESIYLTATKIFIGGSMLNIGGHNIYEALQLSKQIATGKDLANFKEIQIIADKYNLIRYVATADDINIWLNEKPNNYDFNPFFEELNKSNSDAINSVIEVIKTTLKDKRY